MKNIVNTKYISKLKYLGVATIGLLVLDKSLRRVGLYGKTDGRSNRWKYNIEYHYICYLDTAAALIDN